MLRLETTKEDVETIRREIITLKAELRLEPTVHSRRPVGAFHEEHEHMLRNRDTTLIEMGVIVRGIQGDIPDIKSKIDKQILPVLTRVDTLERVNTSVAHDVRLLKDDPEKDRGSHRRHDEQAQELKSDVTAIRHAQTVTKDKLQKKAQDIFNRVTKDAMEMAAQGIRNKVTAVQQQQAAAERQCGQRHSQTEYTDVCLRDKRVQTHMTDEQVKNARRWATVENIMEILENGHGMERPSPDAISSKEQCDTHCQLLHDRLAAHDRKIESLDDNEIRRAELDRRNIKDIEELQERVEEIS